MLWNFLIISVLGVFTVIQIFQENMKNETCISVAVVADLRKLQPLADSYRAEVEKTLRKIGVTGAEYHKCCNRGFNPRGTSMGVLRGCRRLPEAMALPAAPL